MPAATLIRLTLLDAWRGGLPWLAGASLLAAAALAAFVAQLALTESRELQAAILAALLLPRLDAATRTEWLLYDSPSAAGYAAALSGLAIYTALLVVAGLFDFQRRNF